MMLGTISLLCAVPFSLAFAQEAHPGTAEPKTKIQVNFLNTCRPPQPDLDEMTRALARVKDKPAFSADFEISRGLTTMTEEEARAAGEPEGSGGTRSTWVRIRKEFPEKAVLTSAQYSLSTESDSTSEVLALHLGTSKAGESGEVLQILISETVKGTPAQVVKLETPPDHIRIERFGKPSIVLARCSEIDQSSYNPLFQAAADILERYRTAMSVKVVVPGELANLPRHKESKAAAVNH